MYVCMYGSAPPHPSPLRPPRGKQVYTRIPSNETKNKKKDSCRLPSTTHHCSIKINYPVLSTLHSVIPNVTLLTLQFCALLSHLLAHFICTFACLGLMIKFDFLLKLIKVSLLIDSTCFNHAVKLGRRQGK